MGKVKVVLIGAGSASFGRGTIADLMASQALNDVRLSIVLVDVDRRALRTMTRLARMLKDHHGSAASVTSTSDRRRALKGADFVITSVALRRMALWEQDYRVPVAHGFKQIDGENGGPGGAFHALRSIHLMMPIVRDVEELCPEALLLNFTNPENRVCLAVSMLSGIRCVGLCHGAFSTWMSVATILGRPQDDVEITIGGMNHFHWVMALRDARTGRDLMPAFNRKMRTFTDLEPLTRTLYDLFGLMPFTSAIHTGEYLQWAWELVGPTWYHGPDGKKVSIEPAPGGEGVSGYADSLAGASRDVEEAVRKGPPLSEEIARATAELAVPIIEDVLFDLKRRKVAVTIPNLGCIPNLPDDGIVEIPAVSDAQGVHGEAVGPLPEPIAELCRRQITIQKLIVEAYRQRSKHILLQALVLDPVVDSVPQAREMMATLLRVEEDFLPEFE